MNDEKTTSHDTVPGAGLSRRTLLRAAGTGAAALGGASLLAACSSGSSSSATPTSAAGAATTGAATTSAAASTSAAAPTSAVVATSGAAPTSAGATSAVTVGPAVSGDLTLAYLGTAEQQKSWDYFFAQFNKTYPNVKLKTTAVPVDNWAAFFDKVSTQIAGGANYDVIQIATEGMQLFAGHGLLLPLDDYITRDKAEVSAFFADESPALQKWNKDLDSPGGKTYYLASGFNTMCMWLNTDVLKKAGVDVPKPTWTWDDFLAMARTVKQKTGAFMYPATAEYFIGVMPWLTTNGASTLTADWSKATCNTPAAVEAATFARQLVKEGLSPAPGGSFDRFSLTIQGKMAGFGAGRWPIIQIRQANAVGKMQIVPWPQKTGNGSPVGWGSFGITKATKNPEAAWALNKFYVSATGMAATDHVGSTVTPSRKTLAHTSPYTDNSPVGTNYLWDALSYATPIPSPLKGNLVQEAIEDIWGQILSGNVTPQKGMDQMQAKVTSYL